MVLKYLLQYGHTPLYFTPIEVTAETASVGESEYTNHDPGFMPCTNKNSVNTIYKCLFNLTVKYYNHNQNSSPKLNLNAPLKSVYSE